VSWLGAKWRAWRRLSVFERRLLLPTWCLLGIASLAVYGISFRRLAPYLGTPLAAQTFSPLPTAAQAARAEAVGRVVRLAARYTPWASLCQAQAIVARFWLGQFGIPYVVNYGVRKNDLGQLDAHAWVCCGPVSVTGGDGHAGYTVVGAFTGGASRPPPITWTE